ncbi:MAG: TolC family protein [Phycisphaerales bacterium]|nr:TolC family protein [Phycisphaerales bacterium]
MIAINSINITDDTGSSMIKHRFISKTQRRWSIIAIMVFCGLSIQACQEQQFSLIDLDTEDRLRKASDSISEPSSVPSIKKAESRYQGENFTANSPNLTDPATVNPPPETLRYQARERAIMDADKTIQQVTAVMEVNPNAEHFTLAKSVQTAISKSVEYRLAEEQYLLIALDLLIQQHMWSPRFFDTITPQFQGVSENSQSSTALQLVNDLSVSQKLPYGGEVSANILAQASRQVSNAVDLGQASSLEIALLLDIPLLRGAGLVAQEDLIQAKRNMVYGARAFEDFRRRFYIAIFTDFHELVVQQQVVANTRSQIERLRSIVEREVALVESGRQVAFQADLAKQRALFVIDRLSALEEGYKLAVDRFKLRIGYDTEAPIVIDPEMLDLDPPVVDTRQAVASAFEWRLDLQNARDQVVDARRHVDNARNAVLPGANLFARASLLHNPDFFNGIQLVENLGDYAVGMAIDLPLDRTIEEVNVRKAQVRLEQLERQFVFAQNTAAVEVRQATRRIDRALYTLSLQDRNIEIARNRQASIDAAPDRATPRDRTDAVDALNTAENDKARALREVQIAILEYLRQSGQLRISDDGEINPPDGMQVRYRRGAGILAQPAGIPPA